MTIMKCEDIVELAQSGESGVIDETGRQFVIEHIAECADCQNAIRAVDAIRWVRNQTVEAASDDLFTRTMGAVARSATSPHPRARGFWLGAGVGGAIAATIFAAIITLSSPTSPNSDTAEFVVSMSEPRDLNIAIDVDTAMPGATVSVSIYGGIELAGYASRRHLSWTTDLDAGVNKLSLPIIALDNSGGQVIVRLEHPQSQQEFLIQLRHDG
jgi:hypothetical protein